MQTLSPTISPTLPKSPHSHPLQDHVPAIAQSETLQTALAGLDANLNDELDRYRHWQQNGQTISYLNPFRPRAVPSQSIWTAPNLSEVLNASSSSEAKEPLSSTHSARSAIQMPIMPPLSSVHPLTNVPSPDLAANAPDSPYYPEAEVAESYANRPEPMMATTPPLDDDDILQNFANDYAESFDNPQSNFADAQVSSPVYPSRPNALQSLMSPVGIISLLLLLCSSVAIGYLLVDPTSVIKLFKPETAPKSSAENINITNQDTKQSTNQNNNQNTNVAPFAPFTNDESLALSNNSINNLRAANNSPLAKKALINKNDLAANSLLSNGLPATNTAPSLAANSLSDSFRNSFITPSRPTALSNPLRTVPNVNLSASAPPIAMAPVPAAPIYREPAPAPRSAPRSVSPAVRVTQPSAAPRPASTPNRGNSVSNSSGNSETPVPPVRSSVSSSVRYAAPLSTVPSNSATASVSAPTPSNSTSYRVVVDHTYAVSAQQVERNAFVRPSDGKVQIGSYRDANAAQQQIEDLRRQGIPARIE
jgi:hypothetical protein